MNRVWQCLAVCCTLSGALVLVEVLSSNLEVRPLKRSADFVVCGVWQTEHWLKHHERCHTELSALRMEYFFSAISRASVARESAGGKPVILHIGGNHFRQDAEFYGFMLRKIRPLPFRVVVIEPDDTWNTAIGWRRDKEMRAVKERVQVDVANVAVARGCAGGLWFHRLSYQLAVDYNISYKDWVMIGFGGAGASQLNLEQSVRMNQMLHPAFAQMHNISAYHESFTVPCWTPAQLFPQLRVDPLDAVFVAVDAELEDGVIVEELLDAGARPKVWVFESDRPFLCYSKECPQLKGQGAHHLVRKLRQLGYRVGKNCEKSCFQDDQQNIVAVRVQAHDEV